jgi:hypothetical protein
MRIAGDKARIAQQRILQLPQANQLRLAFGRAHLRPAVHIPSSSIICSQ